MNIFLADASSEVRLALQMMLDDEPSLNVTGLAVKTEGLLRQIEVVQPDVLLLDWSLVRESPDDFLTSLQNLKTRPRVIVLGVNPGEEQILPVSGVDTFFYKAYPVEKLLTLLRKMRDEVKLNRSE